MKPFDHHEIETAAQAAWAAADAYRATEKPGARKFYCVSMLPYRPASCTWGTCALHDQRRDVRHLRMNAWNVLMPMGWDAFDCRRRTRR